MISTDTEVFVALDPVSLHESASHAPLGGVDERYSRRARQ